MRIKTFLAVNLGIIFLAATVGTSSAQAAKVGVVDTAKVMKEYEKTKDAQDRFEKELEDKKNELKKMNDELEKEQTDLSKQKGVVSDKKYKQLEEAFANKQDAFREKYRDTQSALMAKQRTVMEGLLNDIKSITADIAKTEKYDLILDKESVLYYNGQDITYKVLDRLNKK